VNRLWGSAWDGVHPGKFGAAAALLVEVTLGVLALATILAAGGRQVGAGDGATGRSLTPPCSTVSGSPAGAATFRIEFRPLTDAFTIMLTDSIRIQEARLIVSGVQTDAVSVMGTIVKAPAPYNPGWSYHLDPASISFFRCAIEVCDASPQYVEDHLNEVCGALLPGCTWCPWSSRVAEEVEFRRTYLPLVSAEIGPAGGSGKLR